MSTIIYLEEGRFESGSRVPRQGIEKDREHSACIYNDCSSMWKYRQNRLGEKKHSIVFIQINFLPGYMTFSPLPFLPYRLLSSESQTRQITIICCYKAFLESLTEVVKIWGLFMSLCIDLTLVRMNCRSIGLPPGRLNEQAQHWGLLLSASCSSA